METVKSFRTFWGGYCFIDDERIIFNSENSSRIESLKNRKKINLWHQIFRATLILLLTYFIYSDLSVSFSFTSIVFIIAALHNLITFIIHFGSTSICIIPRKSVIRIKVWTRIKFISRTSIVIYYLDENNKKKKRSFELLDPISSGTSNTKKAIKILTEEELI